MSKDNYFQILLAPSPIGANNFVLEDDNPAKIKQFDTFDDAKYYYLNSINHDSNSNGSYCYIMEIVKWTSVNYNTFIQDGISINDRTKILFRDMIVANESHWHLQDESFIIKVKGTRDYVIHNVYDCDSIIKDHDHDVIFKLTKDIKRATKFNYKSASDFINKYKSLFDFQIIEDIFYNEDINDYSDHDENYYIIKDRYNRILTATDDYEWIHNAKENYILKFINYDAAKNLLDIGISTKDKHQANFLNSGIFKVTVSKVEE